MSWKFNPYSPCCCHDGTYCVGPQGCVSSDEYGGAYYTEFPISLVETATGLDVSGSPTTATRIDPACFTLAGDTEYTLTIAKDRWQTYEVTFTTPCTEGAWSLSPPISMVPAEGYACPCNLGISPPCVDPIKYPLILNDGIGDIPFDAGTLSVCEARHSTDCWRTGVVDCFGARGDCFTPILFTLESGCVPDAAATRWRVGPDPGPSGVADLLGEGGECTPCPSQDPTQRCGALIALAGDATTVSCSPWTLTQEYTVTGCMAAIYGPHVTLTVTESP